MTAARAQTKAEYPGIMPPPPPFKIRPAGKEDGQSVFRLIEEVLAEYGLSPDPEGTDADLKDIEAAYFTPGGGFFILMDEHVQMAGMVGIYPLGDGLCELRKMYLDKNYRGKRLGIYLMEFALAEARRLGFKIMTLETASVLKEAIGLYTSYGFQPVAEKRCRLPARCDLKFTLEL